MADVFVSYSREDMARAAHVVQLLEDAGWDVFWDQETRAGTMWPKVLEQQLGAARCLVALWTTASVDSRWVRIEAYEALQADKLLPLRLDDVRLPLEFRQTQTIDLIGWAGDRADPRVAHLLADLRALLVAQRRAPGGGAAERPVPAAQTGAAAAAHAHGERRAPSRYRFVFMAGAAAVLIGIAVAWQWQVRQARSPQPGLQPVATSPLQATAVTAPPTAAPALRPDVPASAATALPSAQPTPPTQPKAQATARPQAPVRVVAKEGVSPRCIEINEKFQSTGQITAAERDYLRGKECQP